MLRAIAAASAASVDTYSATAHPLASDVRRCRPTVRRDAPPAAAATSSSRDAASGGSPVMNRVADGAARRAGRSGRRAARRGGVRRRAGGGYSRERDRERERRAGEGARRRRSPPSESDDVIGQKLWSGLLKKHALRLSPEDAAFAAESMMERRCVSRVFFLSRKPVHFLAPVLHNTAGRELFSLSHDRTKKKNKHTSLSCPPPPPTRRAAGRSRRRGRPG